MQLLRLVADPVHVLVELVQKPEKLRDMLVFCLEPGEALAHIANALLGIISWSVDLLVHDVPSGS